VNPEYSDRINRVLAAIDSSLGRKLKLEELAGIGAFSPYHFHRVFTSAIGETLHAYILRKRLQRAAGMLAHRPDMDMTRIAMDSGFSSPSDFSRAFRKAFGSSPKAYRATGGFRLGADPDSGFFGSGRHPEIPSFKIEREPEHVRLEDARLAYITCIGISLKMDTPQILRAFARLYRWAKSSGMAEGDMRFMGLLHDEPEIAPVDRIRYCAALALPQDRPVSERMPRDIAVAGFSLSGDCLRLGFDRSRPGFAKTYLETVNALFKDWMPAHSLAPDDRPIAELYRSGPKGEILLDLHIPVRPI
jgi:AraC family transcriptional regulator